MKCFCNYLYQEEYLSENPLNKVSKRKEPQQLPKALTKDQIGELLNSLDVAFDKNTFTGLRNITMVYAYLNTGLRLSELTNLELENVKLIDGYPNIRQP